MPMTMAVLERDEQRQPESQRKARRNFAPLGRSCAAAAGSSRA